jgi:hypothetical protein
MKAWSNTAINLTRHVGSFHTNVSFHTTVNDLALVMVV